MSPMGLLKKFIPSGALESLYRLKMKLDASREFHLDRRRYLAFASPEDRVNSRSLSPRNVEAQATKDYHRVEKGLALATPKRPFGRDLLGRLDKIEPSLRSEVVRGYVATARDALVEWNVGGDVTEVVSPLAAAPMRRSRETLELFFSTRRSIRNFDATRAVDHEDLLFAVEMAGHTPSVCNRQAWQIRFFEGDEEKRTVLAHQNGSRGFGEIPVLALVTADLAMFSGAGERNQAWIDAGLFSMSFVWALHGLGISTCMLNMSVTNKVASALRERVKIPESEVILMQIAIGYPAEGARIARSPRRGVEEVVSAGLGRELL